MNTDQSFDPFNANVVQKNEEGDPLRLDQRLVPNLSLTAKDHFRGVEGSITRVSAIDQRLN